MFPHQEISELCKFPVSISTFSNKLTVHGSVPSYRSAVLYCITVRIGNKDHKNNDPGINEGNNAFLMLDDSNQNVQCSQVRVAVPFLQTETEHKEQEILITDLS